MALEPFTDGEVGARPRIKLNAYKAAIDTATSDLSTIDGRVTTNEGDITALDGRITTNEGDISSLDGRVTTNEGDIATGGAAITALDGRVTTNEGDISALDGRVTTNEGDITSLDGRLTTAEGDITTAEGNISTLQSTVSGHTTSIGTNTSDIATLDGRVDALEPQRYNIDTPGVKSSNYTWNGQFPAGLIDASTCVKFEFCMVTSSTGSKTINVAFAGTNIATLSPATGTHHIMIDGWVSSSNDQQTAYGFARWNIDSTFAANYQAVSSINMATTPYNLALILTIPGGSISLRRAVSYLADDKVT